MGLQRIGLALHILVERIKQVIVELELVGLEPAELEFVGQGLVVPVELVLAAPAGLVHAAPAELEPAVPAELELEERPASEPFVGSWPEPVVECS